MSPHTGGPAAPEPCIVHGTIACHGSPEVCAAACPAAEAAVLCLGGSAARTFSGARAPAVIEHHKLAMALNPRWERVAGRHRR